MPHQFSILHLSDLHERAGREKERWRRRRVLGDNFLAHLDELQAEGAIDLVCFTGDLADWGLPAEYDDAGDFLATVLDRLRLPRERLFLVPGNHDIARKQSADSWALLRDSLARYDDLQISRWLRGGHTPPGLADEHREALFLRQQAFRDFLVKFGLAAQHPERSPHGRLGYRSTLRLPGRPFDLHVIGLDSAWFSGDNSDAGKLRLTDDQVMLLCSRDGEKLPGYRLALIHHPLTDLADGSPCRRKLAEHTDLLLRGHLHEPEPERWADPERRLIQCAAGCLYEGERADAYPNACQIIRVSVDDAGRPLGYSLRFRAFSPRGGHWHDDNSLYRSAHDGRLELLPDGQIRGPFLVPVPENAYFTGREQILSQVETSLSTHPVAAVIQPQALSGLGGIGKTQIAVAYAYRHRVRYRAVLWVRGDSEAALRSSFADLAVQLNLPVAADTRSLDDSVAAARRWLETQPGWLLIVDGADHPDVLARLLPRNGRGHVLLTSRAHDFQKLGMVCPLEVGVLPLSDAVEFLLKRTGRAEINAGERAAAEVLAKELDGLPLALEQAAAFIVTNRAPIADYLISYQKHRLRLLNRSQPIMGDYPATVATTWHMNFEQIKSSPASVALLRFVAFMAPDAIPIELITAGAEHFDNKLARALAGVDRDPLVLSTVLEPLLRYSLIRRDIDQRTVSVHRMVQEVIKDSLELQHRREFARRAISALSAKFPDPAHHTDWPGCERFLRHSLTAISHCAEHQIEGEEAARLHNQVALYLDHRQQWASAEPLFRRAIALRLKIEQSPSGNSLNRRNLMVAQCNLSALLSDTGRSVEALSTVEHALHWLEAKEGDAAPALAGLLLRRANFLRVANRHREAEHELERAWRLAPQDPSVLRQCGVEILGMMAANAQDLGDLKLAEDRYQVALLACERIHGKDSPKYAQLQVNRGRLQREKGHYEDAEAVARNAVEQIERLVGREHSHYANAAETLAGVLIERGQYEKAQEILRELLDILRRIFGPEHSQVAATLRDLATCLRHLGRYQEAAALGEQALRMDEALLGHNHPALYSILNELGLIYLALERIDDAESAFRRSLALCTQSHGEESAEAATAHNNIALVLEDRGQYPAAIAEYERSIAIQRQCFGDDHPETLLSQFNRAHLFAQLGQLSEAQPLYVQVLSGWRKTYGEVHPRLVICLSGLGQISMALGESDAAERYLTEGYAIAQKVYDPEHPDLAQCLASLGHYYERRGRYQDALPYFERAFAILNKKEPDSVLTATMMSSLGACLTGLKRYDEAEDLLRRSIAQKEARLGPEHPRLGTLITDLGICLVHQDRLSDAEPLFIRALKLSEMSGVPASSHYATALSNLAYLRHKQGRLDEATALEEQALDVRKLALGSDHPEIAQSHGVLGELASLRGDDNAARELLRRARHSMPKGADSYTRAHEGMRSGLAQARIGDLPAAAETFQEAVSTAEADQTGDAADLLHGLLNLVAIQLERGDLPGADGSLRKIQKQIVRGPTPSLVDRLSIQQAQATLLRYRGKYKEARALLETALREHGSLGTEAAQERIALLNNLGGVMEAQEDLAAATPCYEKALLLLPLVHDLLQRQELEVMLLANLASNLFQQGADRKATELYERVDKLLSERYSDKHPRRIMIFQQRGAQALVQKQWAVARQLLERALEGAKESWVNEHPKWGLLYRQLGNVAEGCDALDQAAEYFAEALRHDELSYGKDAAQLRVTLQNLAQLASKQGKPDRAVQYAERKAQITRSQNPVNPQNLFHDEGYLGFRLRDADKPEEAAQALERALAVLEKEPSAAAPEHRLGLHISIGNLRLQHGDQSSARSHFETVVQFFIAHPPNNDYDLHQLAVAHDGLGGCAFRLGNGTEASKEYLESLRIRRLASERRLGEEATTLNNQAQVHLMADEREQAAKLLREALALAEQAKDGWAYVLTGRGYAQLLKELDQRDEARQFLQHLLPLSRQVFGEQSSVTQALSDEFAALDGPPQRDSEEGNTK